MELTVTTFVESLPAHAKTIVVRVGEKRTKQNIVHKFETIPDDLTIEEVLTSNGYGESLGYARLIAYGEDGKQVKSCSLSCDVYTDGSEQGRLIDGILRSNACIRRNHSASIAHNERLLGTIERLADAVLEAREEVIDIKNESVVEKAELLEAALAEIEGKESIVDVQTRGLNLFEKGLGILAERRGGGQVTMDDVAAAVIEDPSRISDLLKHPGIMEAAMQNEDVMEMLFKQAAESGK